MAKANFLGVYFSRGVPGSVSRSAGGQRKYHWFIWHDAIAKTYLAQELNSAFKPMGDPRLLPPELFRQMFMPEKGVKARPTLEPAVADYLSNPFRSGKSSSETTMVTGKLKNIATAPRLDKSPLGKSADSPFVISSVRQENAQGDAYDIPEELDKALRAEFAMGIMRFRRGSKDSALAAFRRLVDVRDGIVPAHKHMFTDFGKDLRKCQLYELALKFYARALELSPADSHAHFNLARVYYEMGKYQEVCDSLGKALELEPDLKLAQALLEKTRVKMESFTSQEFELP